MTDRKSTLFQVALLMLCFLSQAHSRAFTKNIQIPAVVRMDPPPTCSISSIEPAIKCGCFVYKSIYSSNPRWKSVLDFCLADLSEDIQSGERYCQSSPYGEGLGSSVPKALLYQLKIRANQYFRNAKSRCVPTATQTGSSSARTRDRLENFRTTFMQLRGRTPSRTVVTSNDALSGFTDNKMTGGSSAHASQAVMEFTPLSRRGEIAGSAEDKLENFTYMCVYYLRKVTKT